ncbi:MAG: hypothetical protein ACRDBG_25915 [Waterburya sp.]
MNNIGDIKRVNYDNGEFVEFKVLSPLEVGDIDADENASDSYLMASEVALAVTNWNGEGSIDPLRLMATGRNHKRVFSVYQVIKKHRVTIPKLTVEESDEYLKLHNKDFYCLMRPLTVLQFFDLIGSVRKKNPTELESVLKTRTILSPVEDWNGHGKVSFEFVYDNVQNHVWVAAIDGALNDFFLSNNEEYSVCDSSSVLASDRNNAGDANIESRGMESPKGFAVRVS